MRHVRVNQYWRDLVRRIDRHQRKDVLMRLNIKLDSLVWASRVVLQPD